jgi:hypothetical protein
VLDESGPSHHCGRAEALTLSDCAGLSNARKASYPTLVSSAAPPTAPASAVTPSEPWPSPSPRSPSSQTCRRPLEPRPSGSMGDFRQRAPTHVRRAPHRPERRHVLGVPERLPLVCSHVRPMSGSRLIGCRHDRVGDHAGLGRAAGGRADPRGRLG